MSTKLHELDNMSRTIHALQDKISRLTGENNSMTDDFRQVQESLRVSASQASKAASEVNDLRNRLQQLTQEIDVKNREIRNLQERLGETEGRASRENMTLSERMKEIERLGNNLNQLQSNILKLTKENQALNAEYLSTQENLRLSTSQMSKLAAELTELRSRVVEYEARIKKADE